VKKCKQLMGLFLREAADRIGADDVLAKVGALLDWGVFSGLLRRGLKRLGLGPQGYDPLVLFKCLLVGQWHGPSDPRLERALNVRPDFMLFCGLDLHVLAPDEATLCRFRNAEEQCELCLTDPGGEVDLFVACTLPDMIHVIRGDRTIAAAIGSDRLELVGPQWARKRFGAWLNLSPLSRVGSVRDRL